MALAQNPPRFSPATFPGDDGEPVPYRDAWLALRELETTGEIDEDRRHYGSITSFLYDRGYAVPDDDGDRWLVTQQGRDWISERFGAPKSNPNPESKWELVRSDSFGFKLWRNYGLTDKWGIRSHLPVTISGTPPTRFADGTVTKGSYDIFVGDPDDPEVIPIEFETPEAAMAYAEKGRDNPMPKKKTKKKKTTKRKKKRTPAQIRATKKMIAANRKKRRKKKATKKKKKKTTKRRTKKKATKRRTKRKATKRRKKTTKKKAVRKVWCII